MHKNHVFLQHFLRIYWQQWIPLTTADTLVEPGHFGAAWDLRFVQPMKWMGDISAQTGRWGRPDFSMKGEWIFVDGLSTQHLDPQMNVLDFTTQKIDRLQPCFNWRDKLAWFDVWRGSRWPIIGHRTTRPQFNSTIHPIINPVLLSLIVQKWWNYCTSLKISMVPFKQSLSPAIISLWVITIN